VRGKAEPNRKHAEDLSKAPVSLKVTGVSGGTGNPYSRGKSRFTTKSRGLDEEIQDALPQFFIQFSGSMRGGFLEI
jgi:hypothetical protein